MLERALPWIERDIRAVGTEGVVYYCGLSRMNPVLADVLERTGLGAYFELGALEPGDRP